jgi:putative ABC transport system substrate-binding protein
VAAWPALGLAQAKVHRIGYLALETGETVDTLRGPLKDLGYVEGQNLAFTFRSAGGDPSRLAALATELVATRPDVLVAGWGTLAPKALKAATTTIPIVFTTVGDPVGAGLVESLARPGGNLTGLSGQAAEFNSKQLQILLGFLPGQKTIGVLLNPDTPYTALAFKELKQAADRSNVRLELMEARKPADVTPARLQALAGAGATSLFVIEDPLTLALREQIVSEANRLHLPVMAGIADFAQAGALLSYGANFDDRDRRAAAYVDRILKGARPADLPVQQPTTFELVVNQKTATALGLTLPAALLATADRVIE